MANKTPAKAEFDRMIAFYRAQENKGAVARLELGRAYFHHAKFREAVADYSWEVRDAVRHSGNH